MYNFKNWTLTIRSWWNGNDDSKNQVYPHYKTFSYRLKNNFNSIWIFTDQKLFWRKCKEFKVLNFEIVLITVSVIYFVK